MVVKRVNITIEEDLHDQASDYADAQGMAFSVLVSKAVRSFMEGGSAPSPSSPGLTHQNLLEFLRSDEGKGVILDIAREAVPAPVPVLVPAAPSHDTVVPVTVTAPVQKSVKPGPNAGKVTIPEDVLKKAMKYKAAAIENTILSIFNPEKDTKIETIKKGTIQGFVKGTARTTDPEYLKQVVKALEVLEAQETSHSQVPLS